MRRNEEVAAFESRVRAGVAAGELDSGTDARALARYARAIIQGMSQQARDGASRGELEALADMAMANWPRVRAEDGYSAGESSGCPIKRQQQTSANSWTHALRHSTMVLDVV